MTSFTSNISDVASSTGPTSYLSNVIITFCIMIFFLVSFGGNLVTLVTIKSNSHLQSIKNTIIASLCVTDLISTSISPLWLYRTTWGYSDWQWSNFLCRFYWVSDFTVCYVTILHIASFAAFRFAVVRKPFKVWDISKKKLVYYILSLWIISLMIASPLTVLVRAENNLEIRNGSCTPSCTIINNEREERCCWRQFQTYSFIIAPLVVVLPLTIIIICSLLLIGKLIKQNKKLNNKGQGNFEVEIIRSHTLNTKVAKSRVNISKTLKVNPKTNRCLSPKQINLKIKNRKKLRRHRKITFQLGLIVLSFILGFVPITTYIVWTTLTNEGFILNYWLQIGCYFCLRFSECLNPVMYNLGSHKLRKETETFLQNLRKKIAL